MEEVQSPTSPTNMTYTQPGTTQHSKRASILSAAKGLHGAGEALRGSVNTTLAKGIRDDVEMERQRVIKEQGMRELRESGFRDKAGDRLRRRSGSIGLRSGDPGAGLSRVDEVSV